MNEAVYQLADCGGTVRIIIQKQLDGDYIAGVSNGKHQPLICQGSREMIETELERRLPQYLADLKAKAIEMKLNAAADNLGEGHPENYAETASRKPSTPITADKQLNMNNELENEFNF